MPRSLTMPTSTRLTEMAPILYIYYPALRSFSPRSRRSSPPSLDSAGTFFGRRRRKLREMKSIRRGVGSSRNTLHICEVRRIRSVTGGSAHSFPAGVCRKLDGRSSRFALRGLFRGIDPCESVLFARRVAQCMKLGGLGRLLLAHARRSCCYPFSSSRTLSVPAAIPSPPRHPRSPCPPRPPRRRSERRPACRQGLPASLIC